MQKYRQVRWAAEISLTLPHKKFAHREATLKSTSLPICLLLHFAIQLPSFVNLEFEFDVYSITVSIYFGVSWLFYIICMYK